MVPLGLARSGDGHSNEPGARDEVIGF